MEKRDHINEKRTKIRSTSTRPKGPQKEHKRFSIALLVIIVFSIALFTSSKNFERGVSSPSQAVQDTENPSKKEIVNLSLPVASSDNLSTVKKAKVDLDSWNLVNEIQKNNTGNGLTSRVISPPSINLFSPVNGIITESTPPLDLRIDGDNIDSVWITVDNGPNITISHNNGTFNYTRLNLLFAEDFNGAKSNWKSISGTWRIEKDFLMGIDGTSAISNLSLPIQSHFKFKAKFMDSLNKNSPQIGMLIFNDANNNIYFNIYPFDSAYDPSGGFLGQRSAGNWEFHETSSPIKIEYDRWYDVEIYFENNRMKGKIDGHPWFSYLLQDSDVKYNELRLQSFAKGGFDNLSVYKNLPDGQHSITVYAKNSIGNITFLKRFFTINTTLSATEEKDVGVGDVITKNNLEIKLERFRRRSDAKGRGYSRVDIFVKNIGDIEKSFKLDPNPVLIDEFNNQYDYVKINRYDEIIQTVIYPSVERRGSIYFYPPISGKSMKFRLILYINGEIQEFIIEL